MKYYSIAILTKKGQIETGTKLHKEKEEVKILQKILLEEFKGNIGAVGIVEEERTE